MPLYEEPLDTRPGRKLGPTLRGWVYEARGEMMCGRCYRAIRPPDTYVRKMRRGGGRGVTYPTCRTCWPHERPAEKTGR